MYLDYFGLDREPFTISPDPAFLYPSPQHRQALAHLKYGLDRAGGFILLTGEVGTGKTTLTRLLLEQLAGNVRVAYILNAKLKSRDLLASICQELGISDIDIDLSIKALTDKINLDLLAAHTLGKKTLVVIEEAQNLEPAVLETLRLLTNLETNTTKLLHILLVGQPELLDLIARNELRQLNQRVVSRFHIDPLSLEETKHYLAHRLRRANCKRPLFEDTATKELHQVSGGVPRILNLVAERSLLGAYATNVQRVNSTLVRNANKEVFGDSRVLSRKTKEAKSSLSSLHLKVIAFGIILIVVCFLGGYWLFDQENEQVIQELAKASTAIKVIETETSLDNSDVDDSLNSIASENLVIEARAEPKPQPINETDGIQVVTAYESGSLEKNAYEQLLSIWDVEAEISNKSQLCETADSATLTCQFDENIDLSELLEINRPSLVTLQVTEETSVQYLLVSMTDTTAYMENSSGSVTLSNFEFEQKWSGTATYLWKPPFEYNGLLVPMKKDPAAVAWIQEQLKLIYPDYEYIIGGGFYSQVIANTVMNFQAEQGLEADGLIGPRTILRMMDQSEKLPQLLSAESEKQRSGFSDQEEEI